MKPGSYARLQKKDNCNFFTGRRMWKSKTSEIDSKIEKSICALFKCLCNTIAEAKWYLYTVKPLRKVKGKIFHR